MRTTFFAVLAVLFLCQVSDAQFTQVDEDLSWAESDLQTSEWATLTSANGLVPRPSSGKTISVFGGWNFPDHRDNFGRFTFPESTFQTGGLLGLSVGKRCNSMFRSELELSWRENEIESEYRFFTVGFLQVLPPFFFGNGFKEGELNLYSGMFNLIVDFDRAPNRLLTPYVGVGIGLAYLDTDITINRSGRTISNETALAYQAIAGVSLKLTQKVDYFVEYRYFVTESTDFDSPPVPQWLSNFACKDVFQLLPNA